MLWLFERLPAALALLFGLVVGSFLNVCIYRIPLGISVAKGRSFCPACGEKIAWYDNVPLLSFLCCAAAAGAAGTGYLRGIPPWRPPTPCCGSSVT